VTHVIIPQRRVKDSRDDSSQFRNSGRSVDNMDESNSVARSSRLYNRIQFIGERTKLLILFCQTYLWH
jgi:hypothetical protein